MKNRVALITGGTGGLGTSVVTTFIEKGVKVAFTYTNDKKFEKFKDQLPADSDRWIGIKTNALEESSVQATIDRVSTHWGRIDFLLHLIGGFLGGVQIHATSLQQWQQMMELNLKTAFLFCRAVLPIMIKQNYGRIITVGSKGGLQGTAGIAAYAAAKAGLINFTQSLAAEGKSHNIHANVIIPSIIDTPENRQAMPRADFKDWVTPDSLAKVILFLCSDDANDINGATIPVFGKS